MAPNDPQSAVMFPVNYASSGAGTPTTWAAEPFKALSGTNLIHVPHKASGEARNSVIGGHVQMMFDEFLRADIENWARVTKVSGMQTR
jgi:tripartite-type tricarboxylate transporter receptor subunit TctC